MQDPAQFVLEIMKTNKSLRNLRKCMDILRDFHFYYSVESKSGEANNANYNIFSRKVEPVDLHRIQTFDKISF